MASLQIILLGGFQARVSGREIDVPGRKERALLAFLAIPAGEPRSRDKLAGLLWSDRGDSQARESLKQVLFKLRRSLDEVQPPPLFADRESVRLERAAVASAVWPWAAKILMSARCAPSRNGSSDSSRRAASPA